MAQQKSEPSQVKGKAIVYLGIAAILVVAALLSFAIAPHGQGLESCKSLFFQNDRYACVERIAISSQNASPCATLAGSYADGCYAAIAQKTGNSTMCSKVLDLNASYACTFALVISLNNPGACYGLRAPYDSKCFESIALQNENLTMCKKINDFSTKSLCTSLISLKKAYTLRSPSYCANVTASSDKNLTGYIISNFSYAINSSMLSGNGALNAVAFFPNVTFTARDFCYTVSALELANSSICSGIGGEIAAGICRTETGAGTTNSSSQFNYSALAQSCKSIGGDSALCNEAATLAQAVRDRNATMCGTLDAALSAQCYTTIAQAARNATYCSYIKNATAMSACVNSA